MAADFLDQKRNEIAARMKELKPLVEEYKRLQGAAVALDGVSAPRATPTVPRWRSARATPSSSTGSVARRRRGRPKGSGKRGDQALALVKATPGITIAQLAEKMEIKQNYLYRLLPNLAEAGLVIKVGRGWQAKDPA